ncbi:Suppressor of cytokine signaling 2 [Paramuricea clavata]|uniref:Suppressor of cytokine signaling 2 n=1 Tax=Paramuricea clavata TaxID=317549 RepID=A0A7D9DMG1_PARCT|nr:Suppressor of cytokine signaling 2 [Paramuricea clavata]
MVCQDISLSADLHCNTIRENTDRKRKDSKGVYYSRLPSHECISTLFQVSMDRLENTGWYWGRISKTEATSALEQADVGTFLLRDSSDSRYYFSLSVRLQTNILNIRVLFSYGKFMFDCFETSLSEIPKFDCVVKLICYYAAVSQDKQDKRKVLARSEVGDAEIRLEKPLFNKVPTLQHLCRRAVNRTLTKDEQSQLPLPNTVEKFMRKYPYSI